LLWLAAVWTLAPACWCAGADEESPSGRPMVKLSVREAAALGLGSGIGVRVASLDVDVARLDVVFEESAFDTVLTGSGFAEDVNLPIPITYFPGGKFFIATKGGSLALTKRLLIGTTLRLGYDLLGNFTPDNPFDAVDPNWVATASVTVRQPLLRGGWLGYNRSRIEAARERARQGEHGVRLAALNVALGASTAYWELVRARENRSAAELSLRRAKEFRETVRQRIEAEKLAPTVMPEAEANVEVQRDALFAGELAIRNAEDGLRRALSEPEGLQGRGIVPTDAPDVAGAEAPEGNVERAALENRPELRIRALDLKVAKIDLKRAGNERLPDLELSASLGYSGLDNDPLNTTGRIVSGDYPTMGVSLTFSMPIGNRAARSRERKGRLDVRRAQLEMRRAEQQVIEEVRQAANLVPRLRARVDAAETIRKAREESLSRVRDRFDVGQATSLDVVTAQERLAVAERDVIFARVDYRIAVAGLQAAMGTLLEDMGLGPIRAERRRRGPKG
jgi:outer membrane protein TolC